MKISKRLPLSQRLSKFGAARHCRAQFADDDPGGDVGYLHGLRPARALRAQNGERCDHRISGARNVKNFACDGFLVPRAVG